MKRILFKLARSLSIAIPSRTARKRYRKWAKARFLPIIRTLENQSRRALVCYLRDAPFMKDDSAALGFHTNVWECREITRILSEAGFDVDCINFNDTRFVPSPSRKYDLVWDIGDHLARFSVLQSVPLKIAYMTESYDVFNNEAEKQRIKALHERRGGLCLQLRRGAVPRLATYKIADFCFLLGNEWTKSTYPAEIRQKIKCLNVTFSDIKAMEDKQEEALPRRSFLFFAGAGSVHKGLDLVLEVFRRHPEWTLHVVGPFLQEKEFVAIYEQELLHTPNIHTHGFLAPRSLEFQQILQDCFAFLAPSCAEGMATAVITTMALGLHPIISRETGVTLPEGIGQYLETCTLEEIENTCAKAFSLSRKSLSYGSCVLRNTMQKEYSRQAFSHAISNIIKAVLTSEKSPRRFA